MAVDPGDVVVIGAGFAGLSAAVTLADKGFRVAVLERKPAMGGRAYSFTDPESGDVVDNGQHVLMGCYRETLEFLRRLGTYDQLVFLPKLDVEMIAPSGVRARIRTGAMPAPLHLLRGIAGYRNLDLGDRWRLLRGALRLRRIYRTRRRELEAMTVSDLMEYLDQPASVRQSFWYPLAIATLNDQPELSSATLLAEVMARAFFRSRADSAFVYAKVGMSALYCDAAKKFVEDRGGVVATRAGVQTLELNGDNTVAAVRLRDGRRLEATHFVCAAPCQAMLEMLPQGLAADPFFARLGGLGTSPIICVHVWLDREVADSAFVCFVGRTTQWLFNKRKIFAADGAGKWGYLSFVISGARALVERSNDELLNLVLSDLRETIPAAREAKLIKALVIKEKQATMAPSLDSVHLRPGPVTPLANLFLAGDWTQTGLPATIESAVISGRQAAEGVIACASV